MSRWVDNRDGAVTLLRSTDDSQPHAMTRVKGIKDLNVRSFRAQGIVCASGTIRTFIA